MGGRFYAIRVTAGQEDNIVRVAKLKVQARKAPIYSIMIPANIRGILIVEADNVSTVKTIFQEIRHVKKVVYGTISFDEISRLMKEKVEEEFMEGDIVEVVSGPFREMKAKITRLDKDKKEAVIEFLDASFTLPVTISTDTLKLVKREG